MSLRLTERRCSIAAASMAIVLVAPLAAADPSPKRLARAIDAVVARPDLSAAFWGIEVRSLATGRTLYARNAAQAFRPASTMKLVTTAAALDALGPDARLRTTVETAGRLDALGRVLGDVYLVGRGDPELDAAALEEMAGALVAAGIRRIEGRVVGHEGAFTGDRLGGAGRGRTSPGATAPPVSALSFADNLVKVTLRPGEREGDPAVLDAEPDGALVLSSTVATAAAGAPEDVRLEREPGSDAVRLSGSLPIGGDVGRRAGRVATPRATPRRRFARVLAAKGIRVAGGIATAREPLPDGARVLAAHESRDR